MVKQLMLFSICMLSLLSKAQVTINAQLAPAGLIQKDQLWNLVIVNNTNDPINNAVVKMNLKDPVTGQVILTASSGFLSLAKGVKTTTSRDFQPILYNYYMPGYAEDFLPLGTFVACYQLCDDKTTDPLGEDCVTVNIDPLSPPLLTTPADKSEVTSPYPQFSWMPPTPLQLFANLSYDILVTEVLKGQSATEAIQYNTPVYTNYGLTSPVDHYPATYTALDTGKVYGWQVIAKNGSNYTAKTEIWTFKLTTENKPAVDSVNDSYALLQTMPSGIYTVANGVLHLKYYSYDPPGNTTISFSDETGAIMHTVTRSLVTGDNYIDIDVKKHFQSNRLYKAVISDSESKKYFISFNISQ